MSLARAERRRLVKRRFTRYMLLIVLGVLATVAITTFTNTEKVGPEQVAAAQREAEQQYQQQLQEYERFVATCQQDNRPDCSQVTAPSRDQIDPAWFMPPSFVFRSDFESTISVFAAILALFAFAVGASYVGAEWHSGGMMNLLLWRPRRLTVLLTKLGTLLGGMVGLFLALGAAWTATFWGIATMRGNTDRMTSGVWQSLGLTGLRGLGLVLAAGVVGFALASIGRHTALALGTAVGLVVVGFVGLHIALQLIGVRFLDRWLWPSYLQAWMEKRVKVFDYNSCDYSALGGCQPGQYDITWQQSALVLGVAAVAVLGGAMWMMRRRDIT
jgi:ABC-type transport system involved in multi-copper enzyme maturation permease subunit